MDRCMVRLITAEDCPGFYIRVLRSMDWQQSDLYTRYFVPRQLIKIEEQ